MLPINKISKMRKKTRRSHHALKRVQWTLCRNCGAAKLPHAACSNCGYVRHELSIQPSKDA